MRMKFKPWAREELETSPFYIDNPCDYKGKRLLKDKLQFM